MRVGPQRLQGETMIRKMVYCLALLGFVLAGASARAATIPLANGGTYDPLTAGDTYFTTLLLASGPFSQTYTFHYVPPPNLTDMTVTTNNINPPAFGIPDLSFDWSYGGNGVSVGALGSLTSGPVGAGFTTSLPLALAGWYVFNWAGTVPAAAMGLITLTITLTENINQIPAPIPSAFLLFGSALGGLGWLARRRKRTMTVVAA